MKRIISKYWWRLSPYINIGNIKMVRFANEFFIRIELLRVSIWANFQQMIFWNAFRIFPERRKRYFILSGAIFMIFQTLFSRKIKRKMHRNCMDGHLTTPSPSSNSQKHSWQWLLITKTCLFNYTEKLITEKLKIFRQKIQIFFIFLLKT